MDPLNRLILIQQKFLHYSLLGESVFRPRIINKKRSMLP